MRINPQDAAECVRQYNKSSYRGWLNTTLDRRAYDLFRNGLSLDADRLLEQITFVGEQYGGAQERVWKAGRDMQSGGRQWQKQQAAVTAVLLMSRHIPRSSNMRRQILRWHHRGHAVDTR